MVHFASVWVPFTSESKEAIASYPEIQKELRLAYQAVGRRLGLYLRRRLRVKQQGERRNIFLRYLKEVANAVAVIRDVDREAVYRDLMDVAKRVTAEADLKLDEHGRPVSDEPTREEFDGAVIIVESQENAPTMQPAHEKPIQLRLFGETGSDS